ncbi:MAG: hypothetical protein IJ486_05590 [Firmicutes bacterium]|nr:hypothetical protein [Bacillota bacterium]
MFNMKSLATPVLVVLVFAVALVGMNVALGPIIAENQSSMAFGPLMAVMPEAQGFEAVEAELPENILAVYKETSGLGYAVRCSATSQYSAEPMEMTFAIDAEGKICGMQVDVYTESKDFGPEYPQTFVGQDSTLADVGLVSGVTYSCVAYKDSVSAAFTYLIENGLVAEGVKGADQILMEMLPNAHSGLVLGTVGQYEEMEVSGSMVSAMKARNGSGFAYIMTEGDASYLVVTNNFGAVKVFDVEGADVTADHAALADEALAHASANGASFFDAAKMRFEAIMSGASGLKEIEGITSFNSIVEAVTFKFNGSTHYGFYSRSYGYANEPMDIFIVLDSNGAIAAETAKELILHGEYFNAYTLDEPSYKAGFKGLTADTWSADVANISGATMTSVAMATATEDAFEAFQSIMNGGN